MLLLVLKHAKGFTENEIAHEVKTEPKKKAPHVRHLVRFGVCFDTLVELINIFQNFGLMLQKGCRKSWLEQCNKVRLGVD